jgi:hypothetical protein
MTEMIVMDDNVDNNDSENDDDCNGRRGLQRTKTLTSPDETTTMMTTMTMRATTPAIRQAMRATIAIATPHRRQRRLCIGKGEDTGSASSLAAGGRKKNNSIFYLFLTTFHRMIHG